MPSEALNQQTRREWRELGFFYDRDEQRREWLIRGARDGIRRFCTLLREYGANPRNAMISEHEHYGPYSYLEFVTTECPEITGHAIGGRLTDFATLAALVEQKLAGTRLGDVFDVGPEYGSDADYVIRFQVEDDGFDPAAADPYCWGDDAIPQPP